VTPSDSPELVPSNAHPARAKLTTVLVFALKWGIAGLAFAAVSLLIRPDLRNSSAPAKTPATRPQSLQTQQPAPLSKSEPLPASVTSPVARSENVPAKSPVEMSYADVVARAAPAVVYIYSERLVTEPVRTQALLYGGQSPEARQRVEGRLGSGVIIDAQGHVVTNHHVIANAKEIHLQLIDGRMVEAKLVGDDLDTDLALLQIKLAQLPVITMGRSDQLRVGDTALAIGYPYGLSQSVTHGIISATGRDQLGLAPIESYIQTDAAINEGNSGGALINARGELIGINTAILAQNGGSEGIGFAVPVNMVRGVTAEILKHGRVLRGWLGVNAHNVSPERAAQLSLAVRDGAELIEVYADSPAARAGLQKGDVITALNGQVVHDSVAALNRVAALKPGSRLRIQGHGTRGVIDLQITIAQRPLDVETSPEANIPDSN
jgi:serine protease DegS